MNIAPASKAVQYQKVAYNGKLHEINPYRGDPRPELDKAWRDLLRNSNIRISKEELQRMNRTSIELYDGSGYHGQLNAYHHLHCLVCNAEITETTSRSSWLINGQKYLRQVLHSDYYTDVNTPDRDYHVGKLPQPLQPLDIRRNRWLLTRSKIIVWTISVRLSCATQTLPSSPTTGGHTGAGLGQIFWLTIRVWTGMPLTTGLRSVHFPYSTRSPWSTLSLVGSNRSHPHEKPTNASGEL